MTLEQDRDQQVHRSVARIQARILAVSLGLVFGLGLFLTTAWLIVKDGPHMGQHLQLLGQYFIGYSVSWPGACIGFIYGALTGCAAGWLVSRIYNLIAGARFK